MFVQVVQRWGLYLRVGSIVEIPGISNSSEPCLIAITSGGDGNVDITKDAIKDFILKCFVMSNNTTRVNNVENTVQTMTKILLSHLGSKGLGGLLFPVSLLMGILFPFLSILPNLWVGLTSFVYLQKA